MCQDAGIIEARLFQGIPQERHIFPTATVVNGFGHADHSATVPGEVGGGKDDRPEGVPEQATNESPKAR
jgi:hypothetical protein